MDKTVIPARGLTHSGKFHADDVFSTALLELLNPEFQVERVLEVPADFDGIVYDIGGGAFDHHQTGAPCGRMGFPMRLLAFCGGNMAPPWWGRKKPFGWMKIGFNPWTWKTTPAAAIP